MAKFKGSDLSDVDLSRANLTYGDLSEAKLSGARLVQANFNLACMIDSDLSHAELAYASFRSTDMSLANFDGAILLETIFANTNLSKSKGLETCKHFGPSTIDFRTLQRSESLSESFLHDCGVPKEIINFAPTHIDFRIQWHSCFISYSTKDDEFAKRLHSRMREANMRVWIAAEDLKGGKKLFDQISDAIQVHDRLLLVLSDSSIQSEWVMTEIRKARDVERREKRRKLFPIRLVNYEALKDWTCFDADTGKDLAREVREYFIPDFSDWKNKESFEAVFARLQQDLKEESKPHGKVGTSSDQFPVWL